MDKITIVGTDGKPKYELGPDNSVTDLRDHCTCHQQEFDCAVPYQVNGEQKVCLICGLPIMQNP